jgi:hypothetical protein
MVEKNIYTILSEIQANLNAPKTKKNNFGNYFYRSCEDILNALKPYLSQFQVSVVIEDDIVLIANRVYVKATASIRGPNGQAITTQAFAREAESKKGMDEAQVTGSASSYARKYALNALFAIDDSKDADDYDNREAASANKAAKIPFKNRAEYLLELAAKDKGTSITIEAINHVASLSPEKLEAKIAELESKLNLKK